MGLGALSFSAPFVLLALISLPAIWLLLRATPPSPQRVKFPAFVILRQLKNTEETPDRTPWWLLLLRLFIAALVIFALAGPILDAPDISAEQRPLLIVVDDTWPAASSWRLRREALSETVEEARLMGGAVRLLTTAPKLIDAPLKTLTPPEFSNAIRALQPTSLQADYEAALDALSTMEAPGPFDIRWYSDGVAGAGAQALADALNQKGALTVILETGPSAPFLRPHPDSAGNDRIKLERMRAGEAWTGDITAIGNDGRELLRRRIALEPGQTQGDIEIDLPLALRNAIASIRLAGVASTGAVQLTDSRSRQLEIGVLGGGEAQSEALLSGAYYVRKALSPYASFVDGDLGQLIASSVSVIILDDVGRLRAEDVATLTDWIEGGGVLIRFAGPSLADAAQDSVPDLLPVQLRGGGRAFGGALSWETPQPLGAFNRDGPFAGMTPPTDVLVRRQVLAAPGAETSAATWASLEDGTPLVTGTAQGAGALVLFHMTATPDWSDLPLSAIFVDMLRKLSFLAATRTTEIDENPDTRFAPLRVLDGYGQLNAPPATVTGVTLAEAAQGPSPSTPPGLYGAPEAPFAINAVDGDTELTPLQLSGVQTMPYEISPPRRLAPPLIVIALSLLMVDALAALWLSGKIRLPRMAKAVSIAAASIAITLAGAPDRAQAQSAETQSEPAPLDPPVGAATLAAALETRLAFVMTGDPQIDRISEQGLAALSRELARRTAFEPGPPRGVNPETDDLSVYPLLYWPVTPGMQASSTALSNIENFMRFGGLVIFDTRDDERAVAGLDTPERMALQVILRNINTPPLAPLPEDHVLKRSFYLIDDLYGRASNNTVWVEAGAEVNDGVTSLIIGGRDWAGAWAVGEQGQPLRPMASRNPRAREYSYRTGINIVMVALTGNYKSDQVHTPILLERLGKE